ncbi:MAG: pilin [Candidatus Saccharimonadales bacterium]
MKQWKVIAIAVAMMGMGAVALPATDSSAIKVFEGCKGNSSQAVCEASKKEGDKQVSGIAKKVINTMLYLLGIISVIMIVVGGIRYTTSTGDSSRIKASKDTIMYAIVGLVVALMAYSIVNFVVGRL